MAIRMMRALSILGITSCLVFSGIWFVLAVQGVGLFPGQSSRANDSYSGSGTLYDAQPGNVSYVDVSGDSVTKRWAGFYGNISGNLTLEDANGDVFYDWIGIGTARGEVYASNTSTVTWSTVNCTNSTQIDAINTYLNVSSTDRDSVNATYTSSTHPAFSVATVSIPANTCNSTNAYTNGAPSASLFNQVILADNNSIPVFVALINASAASYAGDLVDFELLAGVPGGPITSQLYFFMELGE